MNDQLTERLNAILPKITSPDFLSGQGIGNEIPFYIFDYPPEAELQLREHIDFLRTSYPSKLRILSQFMSICSTSLSTT